MEVVIITYLVFWFIMLLASILVAEEYKYKAWKRKRVKWWLMWPIPAIIYYIVDLYFIKEK